MSVKSASSSNTNQDVAVLFPDIPDQPVIVSVTDVGTNRPYNNGAISVACSSGATGGAASSFIVTSTPGSYTATSASPVTVTGLQNSTAYTFTAIGQNKTGTGTLSSNSSSAITPTTVPQAPTIGTVSVTNKTTISVPFVLGASGGKGITSFLATSSPSIALSVSGNSSPLTITGSFALGQSYTFQIAAVNANGTSLYSSASNAVTPNQ